MPEVFRKWEDTVTEYIVTIMTGSSSDNWILLALWLQPLLITHTYSAITISSHFTVHRCMRTRILSLH
jgi:hypothetical protein